MAVAVVGLVLGTGCRLSVAATVDVRADGSGVVRAAVGLDDEALARAGNLETQLELEDLEQAGWEVTGPVKEGDDLTWVRASKPFSHPGEAQGVMAELGGRDGPFRDFEVTRSRSLARTRTTFSGFVDLSGGLASFSDTDVRQRLGGVDLAAQVPPESVHISVAVRLPGSERAEGADPSAGGVVWTPQLGQQLRLHATSSSFEPIPVVPGAIALVAALLALVVVVRRRGNPPASVRERPPLPPDWPVPE